ncbi:hypothetical protein [Acetobacter orientalis]|uniref:hypothetical protein n=1 Tax=Acetobacter orientalis TaxID=146474 RepID=UPI0039EBFBB6
MSGNDAAEAPYISYQDSEFIRQIAFEVADKSGLRRGTQGHKRSTDLARTLLTECHRLCRPLALATMRRAPVEEMKSDLTLLRQHLDIGTCTLPAKINLRFEARYWPEPTK